MITELVYHDDIDTAVVLGMEHILLYCKYYYNLCAGNYIQTLRLRSTSQQNIHEQAVLSLVQDLVQTERRR